MKKETEDLIWTVAIIASMFLVLVTTSILVQ